MYQVGPEAAPHRQWHQVRGGGVTNEDVLWTAEVFAAAESVVFIGGALYFYFAREASVTSSLGDHTAIVFRNCRKLEEMVQANYPSLCE